MVRLAVATEVRLPLAEFKVATKLAPDISMKQPRHGPLNYSVRQ